MRTTKMVLGIISMVFAVIIMFQSCAVGLGNSITNNHETSGSTGFLLSIFLIAAGIVGIVARKSRGGAIAATIIYALGGLIGVSNIGTYKDLTVWSTIAFMFAAVFFISIFVQKYSKNNSLPYPQNTQEIQNNNNEQ